MCYKNGQNAKVSGCICNQFSIQQILQNNWFNNIKSLRQLILLGNIQWIKQAKEF